MVANVVWEVKQTDLATKQSGNHPSRRSIARCRGAWLGSSPHPHQQGSPGSPWVARLGGALEQTAHFPGGPTLVRASGKNYLLCLDYYRVTVYIFVQFRKVSSQLLLRITHCPLCLVSRFSRGLLGLLALFTANQRLGAILDLGAGGCWDLVSALCFYMGSVLCTNLLFLDPEAQRCP